MILDEQPTGYVESGVFECDERGKESRFCGRLVFIGEDE